MLCVTRLCCCFFWDQREKGNKEVLACWSHKYLLCLFSGQNTFSHCCVTKTWQGEKSAYRCLMNGTDFSVFLFKTSFFCVLFRTFYTWYMPTWNQNWPYCIYFDAYCWSCCEWFMFLRPSFFGSIVMLHNPVNSRWIKSRPTLYFFLIEYSVLLRKICYESSSMFILICILNTSPVTTYDEI